MTELERARRLVKLLDDMAETYTEIRDNYDDVEYGGVMAGILHAIGCFHDRATRELRRLEVKAKRQSGEV